jgi:hypothetical protein
MLDDHLERSISLQVHAAVLEEQTSGCPFGSTFGPCREWQETMSTSAGKCFSKAAISGALHEVWPPTIAPSFVAAVCQLLAREERDCHHIIQGPYCATTLSIDAASTL